MGSDHNRRLERLEARFAEAREPELMTVTIIRPDGEDGPRTIVWTVPAPVVEARGQRG
jgi:hypothetical protein